MRVRFYLNRQSIVSKRGKLIPQKQKKKKKKKQREKGKVVFLSVRVFFSPFYSGWSGFASQAGISPLASMAWRDLEENLVLGLDMPLDDLLGPKPIASERVQNWLLRRVTDIAVTYQVPRFVLEGQEANIRINLILKSKFEIVCSSFVLYIYLMMFF